MGPAGACKYYGKHYDKDHRKWPHQFEILLRALLLRVLLTCRDADDELRERESSPPGTSLLALKEELA